MLHKVKVTVIDKKCYVDLQDNTVMILSQDLVLVIK